MIPRRDACLAALLLLVGVRGAAGDDATTRFPATHHGIWFDSHEEYGGLVVPAEVASKGTLVVKKDTLVMSNLTLAAGVFSSEGEPAEFRYELNPAKSPKEIDLIFNETRMLGIYEMGEDRLSICWQPDGRARPKEFKTGADPAQTLVVAGRISEDREKPQILTSLTGEMIVAALAKEGHKGAKVEAAEEDADRVTVRIEGHPIHFTYHKNVHILTMQLAIPKSNADFQKINAWNKKRKFYRAYLDDEGDANLACEMMIGQGIHARNLALFFGSVASMKRAFALDVCD